METMSAATGGESGSTSQATESSSAASSDSDSLPTQASESHRIDNEFLTSGQNVVGKHQKRGGKTHKTLADLKSMAEDPNFKGQSIEPPSLEGATDEAGNARIKDIPVHTGEVTTAMDPLATEAPEIPAYEPNYKFKAIGEEHEIPELFRELVKDADSEKQVREIMEQAYGLPKVKERYGKLEAKTMELHNELTQYQQSVESLREMYGRGDMDSFFQTLQIPEEKVLQWVVDKINLRDMPPEQRSVHDARMAAEKQNFLLEKRLNSLESKLSERTTQHLRVSLDSALGRAEVQGAAAAFDARMGKPGAFRQAVVNHGELSFYRSNGERDLSPDEAIQEVIGLYGLSNQEALSPKAVKPQLVESPQASQTPSKPKIIPNVQSRSATPASTRPRVRSTEDLRKIRAERFGG